MLLLWDTRDLIDIAERDNPRPMEECASILKENHAFVVITITHLREIAAPLAHTNSASVLRTINAIECLPLRYVEPTALFSKKFGCAARAFLKNEEPCVVPRFADRLDRVTESGLGSHGYINYPPSEMVMDVWHHRPDIFSAAPRWGSNLRTAINPYRGSLVERRERGMKELFRATVAEHLLSLPVAEQPEDLEAFSAWLLDEPSRSPGFCLWSQVRAMLVRNMEAPVEDSDIADLSWFWLIPYVDHVTLDKRMREYLAQALRRVPNLRCAEISSVTTILKGLEN